jgi:hypothetical protein
MSKLLEFTRKLRETRSEYTFSKSIFYDFMCRGREGGFEVHSRFTYTHTLAKLMSLYVDTTLRILKFFFFLQTFDISRNVSRES